MLTFIYHVHSGRNNATDWRKSQLQNGEKVKNFPARLKSLRGVLSMTDFAEQIGVSVKTYQHYECGRRAPSLSFVIKVCHALEISSDWLLGLSSEHLPRISVSASGGSVAANNSTVKTGGDFAGSAGVMNLIAAQQNQINELKAELKRISETFSPQGDANGLPTNTPPPPPPPTQNDTKAWRPKNW